MHVNVWASFEIVAFPVNDAWELRVQRVRKSTCAPWLKKVEYHCTDVSNWSPIQYKNHINSPELYKTNFNLQFYTKLQREILYNECSHNCCKNSPSSWVRAVIPISGISIISVVPSSTGTRWISRATPTRPGGRTIPIVYPISFSVSSTTATSENIFTCINQMLNKGAMCNCHSEFNKTYAGFWKFLENGLF